MPVTSIAPLLRVADVARSLAFYQRLLDLPRLGDFTPPGRDAPVWANLGRGPVELMLGLAEDPGATPLRAELYVRVDDVAPVEARARADGVEVHGPFVRAYQMKEIELRDPDGFLVIVGADTDDAPTPE